MASSGWSMSPEPSEKLSRISSSKLWNKAKLRNSQLKRLKKWKKDSGIWYPKKKWTFTNCSRGWKWTKRGPMTFFKEPKENTRRLYCWRPMNTHSLRNCWRKTSKALGGNLENSRNSPVQKYKKRTVK
jgi:hypothetical protein